MHRKGAGDVLLAIEKPQLSRPTLGELLRDSGPQELSTALVALLFSSSGPLAVILASAAVGELGHAETASWIFGAFLGNGILTIILTYLYRSPQAYFWTIPGTVLVGDALRSSTFNEVIGAYLVTAVLVFFLGWTGLIGRLMRALPATIVMAMVGGIFLRFGLDLIAATLEAPNIAIPMLVAFLACSFNPRIARMAPPVAVAALIGTVVVFASGMFNGSIVAEGIIATPVITTPEWSLPTMMELVIPLTITVVIVQNGQGTAVLAASGHKQGANLSAAASGVWSIPMAFLGTTSTCLTGPTNSILVSTPNRSRHYATAIWCGIGAIIIGLFAPAFTSLMLGLPKAFISTLAGVAMFVPLKNAFVAGFSGPMSSGALACLLVTISDIHLLGISAPFWGLVVGCICAAILDPRTKAKRP